LSHQIYRIIDANRDRIGEGLRFLEDIARFMLDDNAMSEQLKSIRHDLVEGLNSINMELISERDAEDDTGAGIDTTNKERTLPSLIIANSKRIEESLRVLEELAKLAGNSNLPESGIYRDARFQLYTLEKKLLSRVTRTIVTDKIKGLYVILDTQLAGEKDIVDCARKALTGGAGIIQLRDKSSEKEKLIPVAREIKDLCHKADALFIVNDYLDLALAVDADGLHLGQTDLPISIAREALRIDKIIGRSTHSSEQALQAEKEGADYIGVGSIFPTGTKENADIIGIEALQTIRKAVAIPIVAIGGINGNNIRQVVHAGADSAAVISAIFSEDGIEQSVKRMVKEIEQERKNVREH
jgi:thiamine-phosphate pyrophosphorylase